MDNTSGENVRWDLNIFYKDPNDPNIASDIETLTKKAKEFSEKYKGNLKETLKNALEDYGEIDMLSNKILSYLYLLQSTNVADEKVKAALSRAEQDLSAVQARYLTFFDLELGEIEEEVLKNFYETDSFIKKHKPWIEHIRSFKKHFLSESVEAALQVRSPYGQSAWSDFFDEFESDLEFQTGNENKKTLTEILHELTESKDAAERARLLKIINDGLGGYFAKYSAQTLYITTGSRATENSERGYANPMESRNKSNRIPENVVEALHKAVTEVGGPLAKRYYRLKARLLGLSTLGWGDRNAPMPFSDTTKIPFSEAWDVVLGAYESFSPTLANLIKEAGAQKRIDAPATKNKRGGAFNMSIVLPGHIPASFTFLNYLGSNRDVMTLAHELGHGVHGVLAGAAQGPLMFHAPMAYCETASVFGEMTTFNFLKKRLQEKNDKKTQLALLMSKIDDILNTVVRQIGFSNFERRIHGMNATYSKWERPKKLGVEELDSIWLATIQELYGKEGEIFTYENMSHLWSYVSHFHRPFYVYSYAFGELLTHSLYAQQENLGEKFEPLYIEMLESGSTKNAIELLAPFELDPTREDFWNNGLEISLGKLITEAEELSKELSI